MRKSLQLLLVTLLTAGIWGCSGNTPDEPVSANTDNAAPDRTTEVAPPAAAPETAPSAPARRNPAPPASTRDVTPPPANQGTVTPQEPVNRASNEPVNPPAAARDNETPRPAPRQTATVPDGTQLTVVLLDRVSTESAQVGDAFEATLAEPLVVDSKVVADRGTRVHGKVEQVEKPGRVKGRATLVLALEDIMEGSRRVRISTEGFTAVADNNTERDAGIIAGGAGLGAIIGGIAGGKKGAAIGAVIGGGSGTTAVLTTRGQNITLEPETRVNFILKEPVTLPVVRSL